MKRFVLVVIAIAALGLLPFAIALYQSDVKHVDAAKEFCIRVSERAARDAISPSAYGDTAYFCDRRKGDIVAVTLYEYRGQRYACTTRVRTGIFVPCKVLPSWPSA